MHTLVHIANRQCAHAHRKLCALARLLVVRLIAVCATLDAMQVLLVCIVEQSLVTRRRVYIEQGSATGRDEISKLSVNKQNIYVLHPRW